MPDILSDHVYSNGATRFTVDQVAEQGDLFGHRAALFLTPTCNIPEEYIGRGPLDVRLPITTPDYLEAIEVRSYAIPRLWVDLLQRATGKIRWAPTHPARVTITRYDTVKLRSVHLVMGMKALLDALKVCTTGRSDGKSLYYFGAISDDDSRSIIGEWKQEIVAHRGLCGTRIAVCPLDA